MPSRRTTASRGFASAAAARPSHGARRLDEARRIAALLDLEDDDLLSGRAGGDARPADESELLRAAVEDRLRALLARDVHVARRGEIGRDPLQGQQQALGVPDPARPGLERQPDVSDQPGDRRKDHGADRQRREELEQAEPARRGANPVAARAAHSRRPSRTVSAVTLRPGPQATVAVMRTGVQAAPSFGGITSR